MKRTYHTNLKIKYKLGVLDIDTINKIPSSTLYNWKEKGYSHIIGLPNVEDEEIEIMKKFLSRKKLMKAAKALYLVFSVFQSILLTIDKSKSIFRDSKELIVQAIDKTKDTLGFDKVLKVFNLTSQTYYYWKQKIQCKDSLFNLCRKRHPQQLTRKEVLTVKEYLSDISLINWSLPSVYYKMLRDKAGSMGIGSFYKYARLLKLTRQKPSNKRKKHSLGIRAKKPLQILHADLTIYRPLDNTKVYIYFIADNFSRKILAWKASLQYSAKFTFENLKEVYEIYKLNKKDDDIDFMVDDGIENKAEVDTFIETHNINKIIAQKDVLFSNSLIEAVNKRIKYDFLFTEEIQDYNHTINHLKKAVEEYNNKPYHPLCGLTPSEVFEGMIPDKDMYKQQIIDAKRKRIEENRRTKCINHK